MLCFPLDRRTLRDLGLTLSIFTAITVIFVIVFLVILDDYGQWSGYKSGRCDGGYCENNHQCDHEMEDRPTIQQPVNTWTNLAYILAGLWPIIHFRRDISTIVFLLACTYLGIGSFMFHASITSFWQTIDVAATYGVITTVLFHGIYALTSLSWNWMALPVLGLVILFSFVKKDMDAAGMGSENMLTLMVSIIIAEHVILVVAYIYKIVPRRQTTTSSSTNNASSEWKSILKIVLLAFTPGFIFGMAVFIRQKDADHEWCMPDSFWQGHGAWHILTAFANLMIWIFFDTHRMVDILGSRTDVTLMNDDTKDQVKEYLDLPSERVQEIQNSANDDS